MTRESADGQSKRRASLSTSRSLLVRVRNDEEEAWIRLVDLYSPLVCYWCRQNGLAEQDLPDVAQEVFQASGPRKSLILTVAFDQVAEFFAEASEDSAAGDADGSRFHVQFLGDVGSGAAFDGNLPEGVPCAFFEVLLNQFQRSAKQNSAFFRKCGLTVFVRGTVAFCASMGIFELVESELHVGTAGGVGLFAFLPKRIRDFAASDRS